VTEIIKEKHCTFLPALPMMAGINLFTVIKNVAGRESQGTCRQDELIGGKPPS
jgi:hypothetical protein